MNIPIKLILLDVPNIIFLCITGSGALFYFFLHSFKRIDTVRTVLIFSTSSVFGLGFASLFLYEKIGIYLIEKKRQTQIHNLTALKIFFLRKLYSIHQRYKFQKKYQRLEII